MTIVTERPDVQAVLVAANDCPMSATHKHRTLKLAAEQVCYRYALTVLERCLAADAGDMIPRFEMALVVKLAVEREIAAVRQLITEGA